tara:strand:+ start:206 stop:709 length:504 start_codon:yes stop_codon:yes gene_type:complete
MNFVNNVKLALETELTILSSEVRLLKAVAPMQDPPESGKLVLQDNLSAPSAIEIVTYTHRTDHDGYWTLTGLTRGVEGSTASSFNAGAYAFQAFTAGDATNATPLKASSFTKNEDEQIVRVDYTNGAFETITYNLNKTPNVFTLNNGVITTRTCNYINNALTGFTYA